MQRLKKIVQIEHLFMVYNLVLSLYILAAIPCGVVLTGNFLHLASIGSLFVAILAGYRCWQQKKKPTLAQLIFGLFFLCVLGNALYHGNVLWAVNTSHIVQMFCFIIASSLCFLTYDRAQYLRQWQVLAIGYVTFMLLVALLALWCVHQDIKLVFVLFSYLYIWFHNAHLSILSYYNTSAQFLGLALLLALFLLFTMRQMWVKFFACVAGAIFFIALALTYSRTSYIATLGCIGISIAYFLWHLRSLVKLPMIASVCLRLALCGTVFFAVLGFGYQALGNINGQAQTYLHEIRITNEGGPKTVEILVPPYEIEARAAAAAKAEAAAKQKAAASESVASQTAVSMVPQGVQKESSFTTLVAHSTVPQPSTSLASPAARGSFQWVSDEFNPTKREPDDFRTVNIRLAHWKNVLLYMVEHPQTFMVGISPARISPLLKEIITIENLAHTHNLFIQTLFALGLPGLILFVVAWGMSLFRAIQLFFTRGKNFVEGCLPIVLILFFTMLGLQEALMLSTETSAAVPLFFMACSSVGCLAQKCNQI